MEQVFLRRISFMEIVKISDVEEILAHLKTDGEFQEKVTVT